MGDNPALQGFLTASAELDGGGGLTSGGGSSSLNYSGVNPSLLINWDPKFYINNTVETFNDVEEIEYEPPNFEDDNRPQISQKADRLSKHLRNSEISYMNKLFHKNRKDKKTLMDLRLGEIMENTSNFFNNFIRGYRHKIYDTEVALKKEMDDGFLQSLQIYIIAFVRYINEEDNIIYFKLFLFLFP